eukprot:TRINITY_DN12381_c0_g1_i3.p2 TRINITY_DN12381_c0_g1~~TRINITY_DN12381_c0_g1_i3.p2  ORF type:complete len:148 (+),score=30.68 TRINITY_DN12381_c0_g1_i3:46-489(+)
MDDGSIPKHILSKMSFEEFREECKRVTALTDGEIKNEFKESKEMPEEIRDRYKGLSKNISSEEYQQRKLIIEIESLKTKGNELFNNGEIEKALDKYNEALSMAMKLTNRDISVELVSSIRLNIGMVFTKQSKSEEARKEYEKVTEYE